MKIRAFLQALVLVLFLVGSWVLIIMRLNREDPAGPAESTTTNSSPERRDEAEAADEPLTGRIPPAINHLSPNPAAPESWAEWMDYLESASSPEAMRAALAELANSLLGLPREEAIRSIVEFLESGADFRTGLAFQPGPGHTLIGTQSLRAFLLDLLHQLDPELAAEWAEDELSRMGTSLSPDVYAVHLRNYALGSNAPEEDQSAFLNSRLLAALQSDEWIDNPNPAIAGMLDVAVHTSATHLLPDISHLMKQGDPQLLRRAAALTIERLVDNNPVPALSEILGEENWPDGMEKARAGYFARLDPGREGATALLEDYLSDPSVSAEEARFFLLSFPNLNQSLSYNLISSQISITPHTESEKVLENALNLVRTWQDRPDMSRLRPTLDEVAQAISERLYGRVGP